MKKGITLLLSLVLLLLSVVGVVADGDVYNVDIVITDSKNNLIEGCSYNLYRDDEPVYFTKDVNSNTYTVSKDGESSIKSPLAHLQGLSAGNYILKETNKPANLSSHDDLNIEVKANNLAIVNTSDGGDLIYVKGGIQLVYKASISLPSLENGGATILIAGAIGAVVIGVMLKSIKKIFKED